MTLWTSALTSSLVKHFDWYQNSIAWIFLPCFNLSWISENCTHIWRFWCVNILIKTMLLKTGLIKIALVKNVLIKTMLLKTGLIKIALVKNVLIKTMLLKTYLHEGVLLHRGVPLRQTSNDDICMCFVR